MEHCRIYLPKANVTSIWHLAGGNTGPGWQEMNAALHHNEFMEHGQVALCMCKRNHNEKPLCLLTFCSTRREPWATVARPTRKHSSPAPGFWCRHRSGEQERLPVHPNSGELWPSSRQSLLPRWRRAFASTHSLTIPGFWLGLSHRQEHRLTMPATSQDTEKRIIDRIHFQLPSWVG